MFQRKSINGKNCHFEFAVARQDNLLFDKEPLKKRADGKSRHLRVRLRVQGSRTKCLCISNQQIKEPTPAAVAADKNAWMRQVPVLERFFWALGIPTYDKTDPLGGSLFGKNRIWTHSPWKQKDDSTPSCLIYVDENRFHDFFNRHRG